EFDAGGEFMMTLALIAAQFGGGQSKNRPQPLAARRDEMACQLRDKRHVAFHALDDELVDGSHIGGHEPRQRIERRIDWLAGFGFERDYGGHEECLTNTVEYLI